jgi:hypothetical protein
VAVVRARRFLTAALLAVAACRNEDPAAARVRSLARAAGRRDAAAIVGALSPSFEGTLGMRREDVGAELSRLFAAYASVDVSIVDLATERFPEFTLARFVAEFRGTVRRIGGLEGMLPSSARYRFELRLVPDGRELRIATARWEEIDRGASRGD